jgi:hypothetical protein
MDEPTNADRATRAGRTLDAYAAVRDDAPTAEPFQPSGTADAADLLTDLLHLLGPGPFAQALDTAMRHQAAETESPRTVAVFIPAADADALIGAIGAAAENELRDARDWSASAEERRHHLECTEALDRLADAIDNAAGKEGTP